MISVGETDPTLRRIRLAIYTADGSALATNAASGLSPGDVQVSINGAAFTNAGGSLVHIGSGLYYYEATAGEVAAAGFLLVKYERTGFKTDGWWDSVGQIFALNEDDPTKTRLPIAIYDDSEPPQLDPTVDVTLSDGGVLEESINGSAFTGGAEGSLVAIGDGFYYYQTTTGDVAVLGWLLIKYSNIGNQTSSAWISVEVDASEGPDTTLTSLSPDPGDLDADPLAARFTYVNLEFTAPAGYSVVVVGQIGLDSALVMAIYDEKVFATTGQDAYGPIFRTKSAILITGSIETGRTFSMNILPNGGWQRPDIQIVPYIALELTE